MSVTSNVMLSGRNFELQLWSENNNSLYHQPCIVLFLIPTLFLVFLREGRRHIMMVI